MTDIAIEIPIENGDTIEILSKDDELLKEGTLAAHPTGAYRPYQDLAGGQRIFYFSDGAFVMENVEYKVVVPDQGKVFLVTPNSI